MAKLFCDARFERQSRGDFFTQPKGIKCVENILTCGRPLSQHNSCFTALKPAGLILSAQLDNCSKSEAVILTCFDSEACWHFKVMLLHME